MNVPIFSFPRGATISIALDVVSGTLADVADLTAKLRRLTGPELTSNAPEVASFVIAVRNATADTPAGWTLTIPADISRNIPAGTYQTDARLLIGSGVVITDPVRIHIKEPATP